MTLTELAQRVDISVVNLSVLKNGRARAIRFSTLSALCDVLGCQPGDLLSPSGLDTAGRMSAAGIRTPEIAGWTCPGVLHRLARREKVHPDAESVETQRARP